MSNLPHDFDPDDTGTPCRRPLVLKAVTVVEDRLTRRVGRTCGVLGCTRAKVALQRCSMHYQRFRQREIEAEL